ncbi:hypothetical protein FLAVO9AF_410012 [Flavobacterium sp. 9AF]|nr:hypothetical protein FLAVO9AF_410012 [Flavobacterium sp. 9AF]
MDLTVQRKCDPKRNRFEVVNENSTVVNLNLFQILRETNS